MEPVPVAVAVAATVQEESSEGMMEQGSSEKDLPAVFQCQRCNLIISDSTAFIAAHGDLKSITLNRVNSSVELSTKLITSTDGIDQGSTFSPLVCQGCKTVLGKVYRTTPRPLDDLRDCYTFDVNKLSVYQVGSSSSSAIPESASPFQQFANLKTLKETTLKLQVLMCAMHQRILNIEQSLEIEDTNVPENPLQSMAGLLGSGNTSESSSAAGYPLIEEGTGGSAKSKSPVPQQNGGRDLHGLSGSRNRSSHRNGQESPSYPGKDARRSDAFDRVSRSHQTSSDSESSGATTSTSRGTRRGRGSSSRTSRGRRGGNQGKENKSDQNPVKGTKRTKDFGEVAGDHVGLEHGLELLSPIRKKSSARLNKPV